MITACLRVDPDTRMKALEIRESLDQFLDENKQVFTFAETILQNSAEIRFVSFVFVILISEQRHNYKEHKLYIE